MTIFLFIVAITIYFFIKKNKSSHLKKQIIPEKIKQQNRIDQNSVSKEVDKDYYDQKIKKCGRILLLNWWNGKNENARPPKIFSDASQYNLNWLIEKKVLISEGFLSIATPIESLPSLRVVELKKILQSNNLKVVEKKAELIERIKENVEPNDYSLSLPDILIATESGEKMLKKYNKVIWAYKHNPYIPFDFNQPLQNDVTTVSFLEKTNTGNSPEVDALINYQNAFKYYVEQDELNQLGYLVQRKAYIYEELADYEKALSSYLSSELFNFSGMNFYYNGEILDVDGSVFTSQNKPNILNLMEKLNLSSDKFKNIVNDIWSNNFSLLPSNSIIKNQIQFENSLAKLLR